MESLAHLQTVLESRFFRYVESQGFVRDRSGEPKVTCFRRNARAVLQVFALRWDVKGRPRFVVEFAEVPVEGVDFGGNHIVASDVLPGNIALARGLLRPGNGTTSFRVDRPRRPFSKRRTDSEQLVDLLLRLFPEIVAWWESKTKSPHLVTLPATQLPREPPHVPVFGRPIEPSRLQKLFALQWTWPTFFIGVATCITLALAIQGYPDWAQMYVLVPVGAFVGAAISGVLLRIMWCIRVRINRGPFHKGDLVQVLAGSYAGRIAVVYEEWRSRNEVRIDLGEQEWRETKDVFSYVQLCKIESVD